MLNLLAIRVLRTRMVMVRLCCAHVNVDTLFDDIQLLFVTVSYLCLLLCVTLACVWLGCRST
jgi:hypothetical protein